ncbi:MAG: preprotein translocase subunit SecY [Candidatus Thermoplasmatota archaeon]|nr:preprotein translocase subunit SecY [Candidatus Thermoplasmatota archaeon]
MAIERDYKKAIWVVIAYAVVMVAIYFWQWQDADLTKASELSLFILIGAGLAICFLLIGMMITYAGEGSKLYGLKPISDKWPAVKKPEGHVKFRTKMLWTFGILILYFFLSNVSMYGLSPGSLDIFSEFRAILAGANGSLMHLGIGPIVTGSIIMQLFSGAKIINLDLTKAEDKAIYQGVQKVLVLIMIFVEAIPQVYGYLEPSANGWMGDIGSGWAKMVIIVQLVFGSYLVFLMDEVISKWGIGSGISMFIAAGVSQSIFQGTLSWLPLGDQIASRYNFPVADPGMVPAGTLPKTWYILENLSGGLRDLTSGGFETLFLSPPNPIVALISTIVILFVVSYAESSQIELPLSHAKARGARGRYPIRLIYASNIPVILMSALLANVNMFSLLLWNHDKISTIPIIGHNWRLGFYDAGSTSPVGGIAWYVSRVDGLQSWLLPIINWDTYSGYVGDHEYYQVLIHVLVYVGLMVFGSVLFAKFWIETTNMGPEAVAKQIQDSGMRIPGFRRDPRVLKKVLNRYIPTVTVISGAFVGLLAATADMIGTVGSTSGTGVLLAVGIIIRLYEEIGKEQMMEMHPVLRGFFGRE